METAGATVRIAASAALFASAGIVASLGPQGLPASFWGEVRMGLGGLALALALGPRALLAALRSAPPSRLALAAGAMALFQWLFFAGVERSGAMACAWWSATAAPLAARGWELVRGESRAFGPSAASLACFAIGLALDGGGAQGLACGVGAGFAYAAYTAAARGSSGLASTCLALLAAGAFLLGPSSGTAPAALATASGLAICGYLALAATALAYWLYVTGLAVVPPSHALAIQLVQPIAATALSAMLLGASIEGADAARAALCLASSAFLVLQPAEKGDAT